MADHLSTLFSDEYNLIQALVVEEAQRYLYWEHLRYRVEFEFYVVLLAHLGLSFRKGEEHWTIYWIGTDSAAQLYDRHLSDRIRAKMFKYNQGLEVVEKTKKVEEGKELTVSKKVRQGNTNNQPLSKTRVGYL